MWRYVLDGVSPGTAQASKALVLNSSLNISGIGSLSATSLIGTLQTAAQPNITSVGTLTSLALSGGISGVTRIGIQKNIAIGGIAFSSSQWALLGIQYQARATTYTDTSSLAGATVASSVISSYGQPTIASTNSITITRAATVYIENSVASSTNTTITNSYSLWIANGKVLLGDTSVSSSTSTGALVVSGGVGIGGQLTASTIAGTLQTAAHNITSLGTLSSLTVSGGLSSATITGTIQASSQPNITSLGTLSSLTVSGGLGSATITGTIQTSSQPNLTSLGDLMNLSARSAAATTTGEVAYICMPAQAAGYSSWITIGKSSSGNEGGRIGYYHDSTYANQYVYITHNNKSPILTIANNSSVGINNLNPTYDLDVTGQVRITGTHLFAGAPDGIRYSVDYGKMVCLLHKLVIRQQKEINELKSLISGR
ncbi:unnamed protein product [Phytophthora fragariaefolia]|uniref:Unnamed protein product n=1 Tax=Phytophthora fragariaefolia TaxID=1490495 RepID=A0A9W6XZR3_9STRA|nr:unnamed protein product [Phytophthora fragariaefolia]